MKKLLLSVVFAMVALTTTFAADLNPFAYNLKSEYNDKTQTLTINFTLNAPASYVKLAISDGTSDVWTKEYLASNYRAGEVPKATYTETIDALTLPQGEELTWRVDVKGAAVGSPTFVKNDVRLYAPTSVDIDNNPENANFGTVFCIEGRNGAYQASNYSSYISYEDGAGLYVLNADGTARKMPFQTEKVRYGYNGGVVNAAGRNKPFFGNNGEFDLNGYNAYRVRVSDDGRIFVTAFSIHGHVLWEAKKECFSATTQAEWSANTGWHKVMANGNANTVMADTKRNCDNNHQYCGIFSLFQNNASTGTFIAGPNLGFDVRGSGENLKLLMLSGCQQAVVWSTPAHFYCDEYDLGTAHLFNDPTKRTRIFAGYSDIDDGIFIVNPQGVQVQYDKNGNVWMCQHRGGKTETTLARVNRDLEPTQTDEGHNIVGGHRDYKESSHSYRRCGAIRFNEDFTQVVIASNEQGAGGGFTVYPVDASTGMPIWNQGTEVNTYNKTGVSLMDFAWDYAGNLYIAADAATNGERIAVYAMPHAADRVVSTPAASKYAFTVSCQAGKQCTVNTVCNPEVGGTIICSVEGNARTGVLTLESCTELTVTATPEDGYKFLNWTDGNDNVLSTNKEFTFYVTEDITLQANFEYAEYSGITWHNLFVNNEDDKTFVSDNSRNVGLWRLYQVQFQNYCFSKSTSTRNDKGNVSGYTEFDVGGFLGISERFTRNTEYLSASSTTETYDFAWLGKYLEYVNGSKLSGNTQWGYFLYLFVNRTDIARGSNGSNVGVTKGANCKSFVEYGKPIYWRPWWNKYACELPDTMTYADNMPVVWKKISCASTTIKNDAGTAITPHPTTWYKWNIAPDGKTYDQSQYLLAWRDGADGPIVHHASRSNMALYASYVDKVLQESDPNPIGEYDATNNDVLSLLNNKNYGATTHDVTMDRKFAGGMYNTICLPFDLPITHLPAKLQGADIRVFDGVTETYTESGDPCAVLNFITLDEYWDNWNAAHPDKQVANANRYIEAGKPYLIKPSSDVNDEYLTYSGLPYWRFFDGTRTPYGISANGVTFQGVLNPATLPENAYILVADNRIAKVTDTSDKILGYRGYFVINDIMLRTLADQDNVYFSFKKPVTTSIPVAPEAEQQVKPEVRKVMYDGQIYILRGDEVYTITGHRVK